MDRHRHLRQSRQCVRAPGALGQSDGLPSVATRVVQHALGRLQGQALLSLNLRYVEGLTLPEIGEIVGVSAGEADVTLRRALHLLRQARRTRCQTGLYRRRGTRGDGAGCLRVL